MRAAKGPKDEPDPFPSTLYRNSCLAACRRARRYRLARNAGGQFENESDLGIDPSLIESPAFEILYHHGCLEFGGDRRRGYRQRCGTNVSQR